MNLLRDWHHVSCPIVGMLHAPPLPGAPRCSRDLASVRSAVLRDAEALVEGGVHGLLLENFGDAPFFPQRVPVHVATHLTALACELRASFPVPLGVNVLRNDGLAALAVADAAGADFIRVNVLVGARLTDQGIIQGVAHDLLRARLQLGAERIKILADVQVKHSAPLAASDLEDDVHDMLDRGGADGLIVTGAATGRAADVEQLRAVKSAAAEVPVLVGSGVSLDNIELLAALADGLIVGTGLKRDGRVTNPVDRDRVVELMARLPP